MQFVAFLKVYRNLYSTKTMESPGGDWEPKRLENPLKSTPKYTKYAVNSSMWRWFDKKYLVDAWCVEAVRQVGDDKSSRTAQSKPEEDMRRRMLVSHQRNVFFFLFMGKRSLAKTQQVFCIFLKLGQKNPSLLN